MVKLDRYIGSSVFMAIIANLRDGSIAWSRLAIPLLLISTGVGLVNMATLRAAADMADRRAGSVRSAEDCRDWRVRTPV